MRTVKLYPAGSKGWKWYCRECDAENYLDAGLEDVQETLDCEACGEIHSNDGVVTDRETEGR